MKETSASFLTKDLKGSEKGQNHPFSLRKNFVL